MEFAVKVTGEISRGVPDEALRPYPLIRSKVNAPKIVGLAAQLQA